MQQRLTPLQARQKIRHYCAYQERSHAEVKNKLYAYGLRTDDVDEIISELISEDFLNETRFAQLYATSKFRQNQWGKNKIIHSLKQKNVSSYNIKAALGEIDEKEYEKRTEQLVSQKWRALKKDQHIVREVKTMRYMLQKGFEATLVKEVIARLRKGDKGG